MEDPVLVGGIFCYAMEKNMSIVCKKMILIYVGVI